MILPERNALLLEVLSGKRVTGLAVPYVRQSTDCSCGAASLLAVLRYWQVVPDLKDRALFQSLGTNCKLGTDAQNIVKLAEKFGLSARISNGTSIAALRAALADGVAPILNFQAWPVRKTRPLTDRKDGHYAVLVAMDADRAYFMDPAIGSNRTGWLPIEELERAWLDLETVGKVSRRAILIRGRTGLGKHRLSKITRIETGR